MRRTIITLLEFTVEENKALVTIVMLHTAILNVQTHGFSLIAIARLALGFIQTAVLWTIYMVSQTTYINWASTNN